MFYMWAIFAKLTLRINSLTLSFCFWIFLNENVKPTNSVFV